MSMPMICLAAARASSGVFASLMPPALPRPPTGTWAFIAIGPSSAHAAAASSGVCATRPGGMAIPSDASTSLAWYSRSFKSRLSVLAQQKGPVVACHPVPLRVLESHLAEERESNPAADAVRRHVIDGRECMNRGAPVRGPRELDRLRHCG